MAKTTELELAIKIAGKVDPSLQAAISQAQKQVSTLSATLGHIGRVGLAVMGVGLAATVKGIADCTKEAEKFESQMAPVIRYVDGLADSLGNVSDAMADNGKTFKQNRDELARYIQDLSTEIPRDTEQLTQISSALGQSGIGVDEQINTSILRDTAKAATAMDLDDQTAGNYMAKWQVAFTKKDADGNTTQFNHDDVMELMDQINYLAAHNATTAPEVAQSVNQAASFGQIAGIDPAATAAIATAMQATGVATDRVGTSITRIYTNLSKGENATKKQKEMLEELGFTAEGVAKSLTTPGQGVSTLRSIFGAINEMPDERKVAALSTLFGQWAIEGGAKIVNNLPLLDKTLAEVQDKEAYTGSMEREFIINASTSESVSMMTSNAKTALMQDIGEQFLPVKKQFSLLAIDVMNGIRHNLPELQTLASTLADIATKGVTALGDAMQSAMPYIQQGLDYLNKNGEKVAKILAGVAGAFAAMSIAPQAEIAAKGVGSVVKGGAGMFSTAGGTAVKTGGNLLGGLGTLRDIVGAANQDAAMNGSSTTGVLARLALGSAKETKAGKAAVSVGNWAGNLFGNAKDFALSQWDLSKGMADGAIAGANGVKSFINNIISPAEPATTTALVAAAPTALTTPGTAMTAAQAPLSDMGLLGAVMSRLRGGATAAKQAAGNPLKDAGIQILQGAGGMASSAFSGAKTLATGAMPFVSAFGGIASAALPVVAVIGSIVAAVSLLGEHLDDIRNIIGNVFGEQGVAVFDGFLNTITGIKDKIVGVFSPENLASVRTAIVGMFGENAGTGFDNIVSIGQSVIGVFQQIVNFGTQTVKPMFEQVFGWVSTTLLPGLLNAFNALAPQIGPIITNIGTAVMNVANMIGNAIQAVLPVIESIIMVILSVVSTVGPPILAAIAQIAQNIGNVITSIQGVFEGLIQFITGVFTGNWSSAWEGVKSIFSNAFSALVELCKIPINAVIGIINGAINGINSILGSVTTIPEWVPVVGGKGFSMQLPTIPMLAKGGFTDGVSIAGEAGTEAVISFDPSVRSTNIANWQKAGQMLGVDPVQAASVAGAGSLTTDRVEVADIGGGTPSPGGTTTVGDGSFTFSPKITIQGNADYNVMMNAMTDAKDQFEQWFNEMMRKQQRTAYAR